MSSDAETGRNLSNIYAVAHPADGFGRYTVKKLRGCIHVYFCMSIFAYNGFFNNAVQQVAHQLSAIADSQNRNTQFKISLEQRGAPSSNTTSGPPVKMIPLGFISRI